MTEQIDLDALIAVLRKGDGNGCRQPTEAMRTAAEYLDEMQAELRQERERFATLLIDRDGWKDEGAIALRKHYESQAALSRAEETIAAVDTEEPEPEWEYGNEQLMHSHVEVFPASSEAVAKAQAWLYPVRRRRKAGPWEAVPAAENNEREEKP